MAEVFANIVLIGWGFVLLINALFALWLWWVNRDMQRLAKVIVNNRDIHPSSFISKHTGWGVVFSFGWTALYWAALAVGMIG